MRIGEKIYISHFQEENDENVKIYKEPIELKLGLNDLTIIETADNNPLNPQGNNEKKKWTGMANLRRYKDFFHVGDKLYLNGAKPTGETAFGDKANARIVSVVNPNLKIYFKIESIEPIEDEDE
jgi:hypothetical protein